MYVSVHLQRYFFFLNSQIKLEKNNYYNFELFFWLILFNFAIIKTPILNFSNINFI